MCWNCIKYSRIFTCSHVLELPRTFRNWAKLALLALCWLSSPKLWAIGLANWAVRNIRVSIRRKGTVNLITIKAGNGNCSLDFKDLMAHNSGEDFDNSLKSTYFKFLSKKPTVPFISFAALLILASGCLCVSLRCKQLSSGKSKYQRLDMEVPVASLGNSESDNNHGWDNSWDDNWDDEEAPKTPSLPVTPSLSSKGLASRRLSKEGWKD